MKKWLAALAVAFSVCAQAQVLIQPNAYVGMLDSPSGQGNDWSPFVGSGTTYLQPTVYGGLLVCVSGCDTDYHQKWAPWTGSGGGGGSTTINGAPGPFTFNGSGIAQSGSTFTFTGSTSYNVTTNGAAYQGPWSNTATYAKGANVSYSDGSSYVSLADGNTGNTPSTGSSAWGILAKAGTPGEVTAQQLATAVNAASPKNLFDPTAATPSYFIYSANGSTVFGGAGYYASDFIPVTPGEKLTPNFGPSNASPNIGYAWYLNGTFVSGVGSTTGYGTLTVPGGVDSIRITAYMSGGDVSNAMLWTDSQLPAEVVTFGKSYVSVVDSVASAAATAATNASTAASTASTSAATALAAVAAATPSNILNTSTLTANYFIFGTNGSTGYGGAGFYATDYIPVTPGQKITPNFGPGNASPAIGYAWYLNGTYVSGAGVSFWYGTLTVPNGVNSIRLTLKADSGVATSMVWTDTQLPSIFIDPSTASIYPITAAIAALQTTTAATTAAITPKTKNLKYAVFGDSISQILGNYWQTRVEALTGMTKVYQHAVAGQNSSDIWSDYSGPGGTMTIDPSTQTGWVGITQGHTLAQDLQADVPDVCLIELGTNNGNIPLGSPGDTTGSTSYGSFWQLAAAIHTALPTTRVIFISPYQFNSAAYSGATQTPAQLAVLLTAIQYDGGLWGDPVVDLLHQSGLNSANWSIYTSDGVHMNNTGADHIFVPLVVDTIRRLF